MLEPEEFSLTNCLNFGNPQDEEVMGQIVESIRAIGDCAKHFDTPVTGGNVSLYNQTNSANIHPTPTIGMIGTIDQTHSQIRAYLPKAGLTVAVVGKLFESSIYQSEFANLILKEKELKCPPVSLTQESNLQEFLLQSHDEQLIQTAHDCSQGGLIQTLIELVENHDGVGLIVSGLDKSMIVPILFGEYASRCVIAYESAQSKTIEALAKLFDLPFTIIGKSNGNALEIESICMISKKQITEKRNSFLREM